MNYVLKSKKLALLSLAIIGATICENEIKAPNRNLCEASSSSSNIDTAEPNNGNRCEASSSSTNTAEQIGLKKLNRSYRLMLNAPMHNALDREDVQQVKILLEMGANPNRKYKNQKRPLRIAIEKNNIDMVKLLLDTKKVDPNIRYYSCGDRICPGERIYGIGLAHGIAVNLSSALLLVAVCDCNVEIVKLLLDHGANFRDDYNDDQLSELREMFSSKNPVNARLIDLYGAALSTEEHNKILAISTCSSGSIKGKGTYLADDPMQVISGFLGGIHGEQVFRKAIHTPTLRNILDARMERRGEKEKEKEKEKEARDNN